MTKKILVKTDDPENKKIYLTITGKIKQFAKISPRRVTLNGVAGQTLSQVVAIEPVHQDELKILDLKLKYDKQIKAELIKPGQGEKNWQVKVSCYSDQSATIYDVITLTTDSPTNPHLRIMVYGMFERALSSEKNGSQVPENKKGGPQGI